MRPAGGVGRRTQGGLVVGREEPLACSDQVLVRQFVPDPCGDPLRARRDADGPLDLVADDHAAHHGAHGVGAVAHRVGVVRVVPAVGREVVVGVRVARPGAAVPRRQGAVRSDARVQVGDDDAVTREALCPHVVRVDGADAPRRQGVRLRRGDVGLVGDLDRFRRLVLHGRSDLDDVAVRSELDRLVERPVLDEDRVGRPVRGVLGTRLLQLGDRARLGLLGRRRERVVHVPAALRPDGDPVGRRQVRFLVEPQPEVGGATRREGLLRGGADLVRGVR